MVIGALFILRCCTPPGPTKRDDTVGKMACETDLVAAVHCGLEVALPESDRPTIWLGKVRRVDMRSIKTDRF